MDQVGQKLAILCVIVLGSTIYYSAREPVSCWWSKDWEDINLDFANSYCAQNKYSQHHNSSSGQEGWMDGKSTVISYLASEIILASSSLIAMAILTKSSTTELLLKRSFSKGRSKIFTYALIQIITCFIWTLLGVLSLNHLNYLTSPSSSGSGIFSCSFRVYAKGRSTYIRTQCIDRVGPPIQAALQANVILCFVMAVLKMTHLLMTFVISPFFSLHSEIARSLTEKDAGNEGNDNANSVVNNNPFYLTDGYLALLLNGKPEVIADALKNY